LTKDKKNALYWSELGMKYFKAGDYLKAIECFERAVKINPSSSVSWSNMGVAYEKLENFDKERECGKKAVSIDPLDNWA